MRGNFEIENVINELRCEREPSQFHRLLFFSPRLGHETSDKKRERPVNKLDSVNALSPPFFLLNITTFENIISYISIVFNQNIVFSLTIYRNIIKSLIFLSISHREILRKSHKENFDHEESLIQQVNRI